MSNLRLICHVNGRTIKRTCCSCLLKQRSPPPGCLATVSGHQLATKHHHTQSYGDQKNSGFFEKKCFRNFVNNFVRNQVKYNGVNLNIIKGQISRSHSVLTHQTLSQKDLDEVETLFQGILDQNRGSLARGITLVESSLPRRLEQAQVLLSRVLKHNKQHGNHTDVKDCAFRIGTVTVNDLI